MLPLPAFSDSAPAATSSLAPVGIHVVTLIHMHHNLYKACAFKACPFSVLLTGSVLHTLTPQDKSLVCNFEPILDPMMTAKYTDSFRGTAMLIPVMAARVWASTNSEHFSFLTSMPVFAIIGCCCCSVLSILPGLRWNFKALWICLIQMVMDYQTILKRRLKSCKLVPQIAAGTISPDSHGSIRSDTETKFIFSCWNK